MALPVGVDIEATLTLKDDNDTAINLSTLLGYAVFLYQFGSIVEKYSLNAISGYNSDDIATADAAAGQITLRIQQSLTKTLSAGDLKYEIAIQTTDADYANNTFTEKTALTTLVTLTDSKSEVPTL